jgi:hypothetical protein
MTVWSEVDAQSRRRVGAFALKLSLYLAAATAMSASSQRPLLDFARLLEFWFYLSGLVTAFIALVKRQKPGPGALTYWDEALAFGALCLLVHIALRSFD